MCAQFSLEPTVYQWIYKHVLNDIFLPYLIGHTLDARADRYVTKAKIKTKDKNSPV